MFNINVITTHNVVLSVAPQTQEWVNQSLETIRSFLALYTPADLQSVADIQAGIDRSKARLDQVQQRLGQIDSHLQQ